MTSNIVAVSSSAIRGMSKQNRDIIVLIEGIGVEGDIHSGAHVRHRIQRLQNPFARNLRQIHLVEGERLNDFRRHGFELKPGELGENVTTSGLMLTELPQRTLIWLGDQALIRITGLRSPCHQIEDHAKGLMKLTLERSKGRPRPRIGVMGIVLQGGGVRSGDLIRIELPPPPFAALEAV